MTYHNKTHLRITPGKWKVGIERNCVSTGKAVDLFQKQVIKINHRLDIR